MTTAAIAAALWAPISNAQDITSSSCVDGLYMLVARGTGEELGPGITGLIADRIADRIDDSKVVAIEYPASLTDPVYTASVNNGSELVSAAVRNYTENCPDGKLAVFGYSQGAQVTENAFCGASGGEDGAEIEALPKDLVDGHVIAVILFGDPTHRANASYNEGTSRHDGIFERPNITACEDYPFLKSYCDTGDIYCDAGDDRPVHGEYVQRYGTDVVEEVIKAWNNATDSDVNSDGGPAFGGGSSGNSTETTPGPTSTPTETASTTMTESETSSATNEGGSGGSGGSEEGGDDDGAAVGLSAMGSLVMGAPLMIAALLNVL